MKTIVFHSVYAGHLLIPETYDQLCYGSEYALVNVAKGLTDDYKVYIFSSTPKGYENNLFDINWRSSDNYNDMVSQGFKPDIIIISRFIGGMIDFDLNPNADIYFWLHDLVPILGNLPINIMRLVNQRVKKYITVGKPMIYEAFNGGQISLKRFGIYPNMCHTIGNGIYMVDFDPVTYKKRKNSFIFSSSPIKGLFNLLDNWPKIKSILPDATLEVYYGHTPEETERCMAYKYTDVTFHGRVSQEVLSQAMKETEYMVYPSIMPETHCITALQAQQFGCILITNTLGNLKCINSGLLVDIEQPNEMFWEITLDSLKMLTDDQHLKDLIRKRQYEWAKKNTWNQMIKEWKSFLTNTYTSDQKIDYDLPSHVESNTPQILGRIEKPFSSYKKIPKISSAK